MGNIKFKTTVTIDGIEHMTQENKTAIMDLLLGEMNKAEIVEWLEDSEYSLMLSEAWEVLLRP